MRTEEFDTFRRVLKEKSGLTLTQDKTYLLESRLEPVARRHNVRDVGELASHLRRGDKKLANEVAEAMTTNESSFFRDGHPFERLKDTIIPQLLERRRTNRLRVWCAAAAKGQEPLSIAMTVLENARALGNPTIDIEATDISQEMVETAQAGRYTDFEVRRGLPDHLLRKYFKRDSEGSWRADPALQRMIRYRQHNLLSGIRGGPYDIVFCRNVLLYFDVTEKQRVLREIARVMTADGILLLGGAETTMGLTDTYVQMRGARGIYTPVGSPLAAR